MDTVVARQQERRVGAAAYYWAGWARPWPITRRINGLFYFLSSFLFDEFSESGIFI